MGNTILVVDLESTGFNSKADKIVEIGIVSLSLDTGKIIVIFDQPVREEGLLSQHRRSWVFQNSTLTVEEVRNAQRADEIYPQVQIILDAYPLGCTAFNRPFDVRMLSSRGIKFNRDLQDPMRLAQNVCKIPNIFGKGGYKQPTFGEVYNHFFPERGYKEAHRGADDAYREAEVIYELYRMGLFKI